MIPALGEDRGGKAVNIPRLVRREHLHVFGATGQGKSKFLSRLLQQDIENGHGCCLIDPHGTLVDEVLAWLYNVADEAGYFRGRPIYLIEPSNRQLTVGWNPLGGLAGEHAEPAERMMNATSAVWGGEDQSATPTLSGILYALFYLLRAEGLTLAEGIPALLSLDALKKSGLTEDLESPTVIETFEHLFSLSNREREAQLQSSINRLRLFTGNPLLRAMFGQTACTFDMAKAMREQAIVLINLSPNATDDPAGANLSDRSVDLLGTLLVNTLRFEASKRPQKDRSDTFYLYIDECARFLGADVGAMLTEVRKYGIGLVLAHQHTGQLSEKGEVLEKAMRNIRNIVSFSVPDPEDCRWVADKTLLGETIYNMPVHGTERPVTVGEKVELLRGSSISRNSSTAVGHSTSVTHQEGRSESNGSSVGYDLDGDEYRTYGAEFDRDFDASRLAEWEDRRHHLSDNRSTSGSSSDSEGFSTSVQRSTGQGVTVSLNPTLRPIRAWMPSQFFSKDDQIQRRADRIGSLRRGEAIVKIDGKQSRFVRFDLPEDGSAAPQAVSDMRALIGSAMRKRKVAIPRKDADAAIAARGLPWVGKAKLPQDEPEAEDFFQPEHAK